MNLVKSFNEEKYNIRVKSHRSAVGLTDFLERIPNFTSSIYLTDTWIFSFFLMDVLKKLKFYLQRHKNRN